FYHLNQNKAEKILKNPKYFNEELKILDLSKTKYQVIDEFVFHSTNIKEIKLPKSLIIIAKYSFANNDIEVLDLSENKNLEIVEDYSFMHNNIKTFKKAPNIFLYTKKCLAYNPISISFKN
ncbi:MAG: leucine-rich repeat domain-containing protein, partial [Malacoplasma sp.]|nr:leucine-rich repeat domain-containing protein [Malacoplasma sp.]